MLDLVVVGGGPAGAATAIHAALAGLSVRILEPRQAPIDKACGEGLMPAGARMLVDELGVRVPGTEFGGIRYLDARGSATARFATGTGLGVRRTELSAALHERLAELRVPVLPELADQVSVRADLVEVNGMRARWLAAADGLHSPIRRQLGLDVPAPARKPYERFGLRRHFDVPAWTDLVEVHWAAHSEAYVTPVPDGVGVALLTAERGGFDQQLTHFPWLLERLSGAAPVSRVRGAGPLRQQVTRRRSGRVLLVGDAAGYLDALTGEGLSLAFASARELVGCLLDNGDYERAWRRVTRTYRLLTGALLWTRRRPGLAGRIVPAARAFPSVFTRVVDALAD